MKRTKIAEIIPEQQCKISGFVDRFRDSKNMIFIVLRDISGKIQVTIEKEKNPEIVKQLNNVIAGCVISCEGKAVISEYVKMGGKEFFPTFITVDSYAEASPITKEASMDTRFNYRWLDLREEAKTFMCQVQSLMEKSMRDYLISENFIEIHSPKITAQSSEGGSEVFKIDYFGQPAYLTQSPQLYKQMAMAAGFERVVEIGPYFRAESSFTSRHATEFMGLDIEMSFIESHHDVMDVQENMLVYMLKEVKETYGEKIKEYFNVDVVVPEVKFPRIAFREALNIVEKEYGYTGDKNDFDPESERLICKYAKEKFGCEFVFITDYPAKTRAFYSMKCENDSLLTKSYDLLWKDQEITSGAQREHRPEILKAQIEEKGINSANMEGYISFFKYGCPPHGGFGMGLARLLAKMLDIPTIKEASYIFRGPTRLMP